MTTTSANGHEPPPSRHQPLPLPTRQQSGSLSELGGRQDGKTSSVSIATLPPAAVTEALIEEAEANVALANDVPMLPFGKFAARHLMRRAWPGWSDPPPHVQTDAVEDGCDLWVYRYDRSIDPAKYQTAMTHLTGLFKDTLGPATLMLELEAVYRAYFGRHWRETDVFLEANSPRLEDIRLRYGKDGCDEDDRVAYERAELVNGGHHPNRKSANGPWPTVAKLSALTFASVLANERDRPVLVKFYANYCSHCRALAPEFILAAMDLRRTARFCEVNGPENLSLMVRHNVKVYPCIKLFWNGQEVAEFDSTSQRSKEAIVRFALSYGSENGTQTSNTKLVSSGISSSEFDMLAEMGIDDREQIARAREHALRQQVDIQLKRSSSTGDTNCVLTRRGSCSVPISFSRNRRPMAIFLGGGMGSGKTTARNSIEKTQYWKDRGDQTVLVEADRFKEIDPVFQALSAVTSSASRMVHPTSTRVAEELLLQAVNEGRDFVFDSSMSWAPFVEQTVAMIRDHKHVYERGPGYVNGEETYWRVTGHNDAYSMPYQIEMVGVTCKPEEAVMRGLIRQLTSGRGVPVRAQLESHRMFSENFGRYIDLFDAVYLLDNSNEEVSTPLSTPDPMDCSRFVIVRDGEIFQTGSPELSICDSAKWQRFLNKRNINTAADDSKSLYSTVHA